MTTNSNDLVPFDYGEHQVRTLTQNGEPWFVGTDVCRVLGYSNSRKAIADHVRTAQKGVSRIATPSGEQDMTVINEPGLYRLIMRSHADGAEAFQDWVTGDVLPSIRRTGGYGQQPPPELSRRELAEYWADAEKRAEIAEARASELEPDARAWQRLADAAGDHSVREAAQILCRARIDIGQNRLFRKLREFGWIDRTGTPYQSQIDTGRIASKTSSYEHPHSGEPTLAHTVRITPKGLRWLHAHFTAQPLPFEEPAS